METLNVIYWCRVGLGIIAALICVAGWTLTTTLFTSVLQGISLAIIFYIITYYILKMKFIAKVEKTSKLFKQGIGAYFLTWVVSWTLILTLVLSPTVPKAYFTCLTPDPKVNIPVEFDASGSSSVRKIVSYAWNFGDNTGNTTSISTINHTYTAVSNYTVTLYIADEYGLISSPFTRVVEVTT